MTTALAASTEPRWGVAVKVVRMRPRRYSTAMNMVARTTIMISATMSPNQRLLEAVSPPANGSTARPMSPEPLSAMALPERW